MRRGADMSTRNAYTHAQLPRRRFHRSLAVPARTVCLFRSGSGLAAHEACFESRRHRRRLLPPVRLAPPRRAQAASVFQLRRAPRIGQASLAPLRSALHAKRPRGERGGRAHGASLRGTHEGTQRLRKRISRCCVDTRSSRARLFRTSVANTAVKQSTSLTHRPADAAGLRSRGRHRAWGSSAMHATQWQTEVVDCVKSSLLIRS